MQLTRTRETENMLSTAEANNLWDILKSDYMAVELMQIWGNAPRPDVPGDVNSTGCQSLFTPKRALKPI